MRINPLDIKIIKTIQPAQVSHYLRSVGWQEAEQLEDKASIWTKLDQDEIVEILLPLKPEAPDFVRRLWEALETLEIVERQGKSEILSQFQDIGQVSGQMNGEMLMEFREVEGWLMQADIETHSFKLRDVNNREYVGYISAEVMPRVLMLNTLCKVRMKVITSHFLMEDQPVITYEIVDLVFGAVESLNR